VTQHAEGINLSQVGFGAPAVENLVGARTREDDRHFMSARKHPNSSATAARVALAGLFIASGALAMAGQAGADPADPSPVPADPAAPVAPGQPVVVAEGPIAAPVDPNFVPTVPEIANPVYGGSGGSGPGGYLRDLWRTARTGDISNLSPSTDQLPAAPAGAGPGPAVPAGFYPLNGPPPPWYNGATTNSSGSGPAPALPPGYYSLNGPPPPDSAGPPVPIPIPNSGPNPNPNPVPAPIPAPVPIPITP
jgi:hypothetical protein